MTTPTIKTLGQRCIYTNDVKKLDDFAFYFMQLKDGWCREDNKLGLTVDEIKKLMTKCVRFDRPQVYTRLCNCVPKEL